jgi:hypothetical protein
VTCYRPDHDKPARALVGRHRDGCDGTDCHGCEPCPQAHCRQCLHEHAPDVCATCLGLVRIDLRAIPALAHKLPSEAVNGRPAFHTHTSSVPGGNATVMLAPGVTPVTYQHQISYRLEHQLDLTHLRDADRPDDPRPPLVVLSTWLHYWGAPTCATVETASYTLERYLDGLTPHAQFPVMADDLATLVRQLEDVLHDGERPERSRVPCWECGTRLVKVYRDRVTDDHWLCPRCGEAYDQHRYERAKHDHLASAGANRYVSVADATEAIGRPVQTVRGWIRRGLVETERHPKTGRLVAWWPDIRNLHLTTGTRNRPKLGV